MPDKAKIIVGLVIFLVLAAFPVWNRLFAAGAAAAPELQMPDPIHGTQCVESREFMLANHMHLLDQWRDAVVRDGRVEYTSVSFPDRTYTMSLTGTCLNCHTKDAPTRTVVAASTRLFWTSLVPRIIYSSTFQSGFRYLNNTSAAPAY